MSVKTSLESIRDNINSLQETDLQKFKELSPMITVLEEMLLNMSRSVIFSIKIQDGPWTTEALNPQQPYHALRILEMTPQHTRDSYKLIEVLPDLFDGILYMIQEEDPNLRDDRLKSLEQILKKKFT